ncbi:MAG: hypothetical protein F4Y45_18045 [Acidobacteria bacterium]|nr:hypothetical protein [Acidobacteriota bacterium]MYJ05254.1 hypothetical protein [Acidobacteriota bacterium]
MTDASRDLSMALRGAIDRLLQGVPMAALQRAAGRLTGAYRDGGAGAAMAEDIDRLAYAAVRAPATFAAMRAVLAELCRRAPGFDPRSLLDLGSGPGTALWSTWETCEGLEAATHVDRDAAMGHLGERLLEGSTVARQVRSTWRTLDLGARGAKTQLGALGAHDLVLFGYVLGELPEERRAETVDAAWDVTAGALVIVEPGTPAGTARVLSAREQLLARGAMVAAPCPHGADCPLPAGDWCHFGARLNRSAVQRRLKGASLGYEDEKYAYVALTREAADPCAARVLRRPRIEKGHVRLHLCERDGLRTTVVARRDREGFRAARKVGWGGAWSPT